MNFFLCSICRIGQTGSLFFAGGSGYNANNETFHSDQTYVYDVIRDTWCRANNLPHDANGPNSFGMEAVGNKVYLNVGGEGASYVSIDDGKV